MNKEENKADRGKNMCNQVEMYEKKMNCRIIQKTMEREQMSSIFFPFFFQFQWTALSTYKFMPFDISSCSE
jgi:hypothetical protein